MAYANGKLGLNADLLQAVFYLSESIKIEYPPSFYTMGRLLAREYKMNAFSPE